MKEKKYVLLAGGVGGAKIAAGLAQQLQPEQLTIIVNTGDDFQHCGLTICPDIDTVMYTLTHIANFEMGWGREDESWRAFMELSRLGGPDWFRLGDLDLATHLTRTHLLQSGSSMTDATHHLCHHHRLKLTLLPMSDEAAPTLIAAADGLLPFQQWFVQYRWQPAVTEVRLPQDVRASAAVIAALEQADVVIIAPSNPFLSIDPILNCYPIRALLEDCPELVLAVSPIIRGKAVKGPAAKLMQELNIDVSARGVADYYGDLINGFIYDTLDAGLLDEYRIPTLCTQTIMDSEETRSQLAAEIIRFAAELLA